MTLSDDKLNEITDLLEQAALETGPRVEMGIIPPPSRAHNPATLEGALDAISQLRGVLRMKDKSILRQAMLIMQMSVLLREMRDMDDDRGEERKT